MSTKKLAKILMCRPTFFKVKYSINPWMNPKEPLDQDKAMKQWENLKATIEKAGAEVVVMEPHGADQYPDLVFTANAAIVRNNKAYISNFFYPERNGEKFFYDRWFKDNGYQTFHNDDVPFEGAGDGLWIGKNQEKLFCGVGPRTDIRALNIVSKFLKDDKVSFKVYGMRLIDPRHLNYFYSIIFRFYHIDTCFCPLDEEMALYYPKAFDPISRHNMANDIRELVPVKDEDAVRFACNAVVVGKTVIMNEGSEDTAKKLDKLGFKVDFVNMSEFIKSGGSSKCCTLALPH